MASQKSIINDRDVLLRMGYNGVLTGTTDNPICQDVSAGNPDGTVDVLVDGWRVTKVKYDTEEDRKKAIMLKPFVLKVNRRAPNVVIRKNDGVSKEQVAQVIDLLRRSKAFLDMNDPHQWDRNLDQAVGPNANRPWFFEDMTKAREVKMSSAQETIAINEALVGMYGDMSKMRDALFLLGSRPLTTDSEDDLKFALYQELIEGTNTVTRRKFLDMFVHKGMSPQKLEAKKWFEKGRTYGLITNVSGVFISGTDRLGMSEDESIDCIATRDDIRAFLISSISTKSRMQEDIDAAQEVIKKANSGSSDSGDVNEELAMTYVKNLAREKHLTTNPGPMFKGCKSLKEAVKKYNEVLKASNLPDPTYLSEELVMDEIKAKV
jgi:hypothetical protein